MANTHSVTLNGSNNGVKTTVDFTDYGTSAVTLECWVKTSTVNGTAIFAGINDGAAETFQLFKDGTYAFRVNGGGGTSPTVTATLIEDGNWHHLAGVYDGVNIKFYLDGVSQGTPTAFTANVNTSNPTELGIGFRTGGSALYWAGEISNVRVWNDARTATEIQDNIGTILEGNETGLTFLWYANNSLTEETGNYTLSNQGTPTYTTDIPYSGTLVDVSTDSTLATNLLSYWELEEASGTRVDATATGNDLTDNNTVGQGTGIIGNGADFVEANTEWLSHSDISDFDITTSNDRSFSAWINTTFTTNAPAIAGKWGSQDSQRNWLFRIESSGVLGIYAGSGGSTGVSITGSTDVSDGVFHHVVFTWGGASDDKWNIYVDGVLEAVSAAASPAASTAAFAIGAEQGSGTGGSSNQFDGVIDEAAWYSRKITAGEVSNLYNGGSALPYLAASGTTFVATMQII